MPRQQPGTARQQQQCNMTTRHGWVLVGFKSAIKTRTSRVYEVSSNLDVSAARVEAKQPQRRRTGGHSRDRAGRLPHDPPLPAVVQLAKFFLCPTARLLLASSFISVLPPLPDPLRVFLSPPPSSPRKPRCWSWNVGHALARVALLASCGRGQASCSRPRAAVSGRVADLPTDPSPDPPCASSCPPHSGPGTLRRHGCSHAGRDL